VRSSAAIVFFSFTFCIPCFGAGSGNDFAPKILPEHVKLIKGFRSSARDLPTRPPKVATAKQAAGSGICGHIRVSPVPKDMDPKFIVPVREPNMSRMPVHKGLPACQ